MSIARLVPRFAKTPAAPSADHLPSEAPAPRADGEGANESLIRQLEDDMRFTMSVIGREADRAKVKIDEAVEQTERIRDASDALTTLTVRAKTVAGALSLGAERLEEATNDIRRQVAGVDEFAGEAGRLTEEVSANMARLAEAVGRIDTVANLIASIARQTKILALNAGIEAARAGPEGRGFGIVAQEINSLAAKAQTATADIANHIGDLRSVTTASDVSARKIARMVGQIGPVARSVRASIDAQTAEAIETAARAADSATFVESVASKAQEVKGLAEVASAASLIAKTAGETMVLAMTRYTRRSTVYLRNSATGDRRRHERVPVKVPGSLSFRSERVGVTALDISEGGALLLADGQVEAGGERCTLSLESLGDCSGQIVAVSDLGCHYRFYRPHEQFLTHIRRLIAAVKRDDAPLSETVRGGAEEIQRAFIAGIEAGEVDADALITTDYRPIEATDPVQYETDALLFYERVLPKILHKYWEWTPAPVFVFATDRNAYLPVHHEKYSLPQRPNQWAWNDLNSRNKRIMERWQSLVLSRNSEQNFVKVFLRHMDTGAMTPIKAFCHPIFVEDRLWGNFTMGFYY